MSSPDLRYASCELARICDLPELSIHTMVPLLELVERRAGELPPARMPEVKHPPSDSLSSEPEHVRRVEEHAIFVTPSNEPRIVSSDRFP
jgi:hypothetical protein